MLAVWIVLGVAGWIAAGAVTLYVCGRVFRNVPGDWVLVASGMMWPIALTAAVWLFAVESGALRRPTDGGGR